MRVIDFELEMNSYDKFLINRGLDTDGKTQRYFTEQVYKYSEPYTPKLTGVFMANTFLGPDYIHYISPFSNYLWRGKKFVDPKYQIGAFFNENYGFWSRPGILKEETDIDLKYTDSPLRGPRWIERMWANDDEEIVKDTQKYMENIGARNEK